MSSTVPPALGKPALKAARWPAPVSVVMGVVALLLISFLISAWWLYRPSRVAEWALKAPVSPSGALPRLTSSPWPPAPSPGVCEGTETFCLAAASGQPAETLRHVAAALSVEPTRRYQIHLTITPLEDETAPVGEAPALVVTPAAEP